MNFDEAIQKHAEWKLKFRTAMSKQEQMDSATISKDNCCQLGQWLYGEGKSKYGKRPEFDKVLALHKAFHVEAGKVSQLINAKKYAEAEQALGNGTAYGSASNSVGIAIVVLKKAAAA